MTKKEILKLNTVKHLFMEDVKPLSKDKMWREGYKCGFNTCRRKIRGAMGLLTKVKGGK